MPTYEYSCKQCHSKIEILQKITDSPLTYCPECKTNSLIRGPGGGIGLQFKGSGFYITDYKKQSKNNSPTEACPCGEEKKKCEKNN